MPEKLPKVEGGKVGSDTNELRGDITVLKLDGSNNCAYRQMF